MALRLWFDFRMDDRKSKVAPMPTAFGGVAHMVHLGISTIALWAARSRSRGALATLDDDQLRDVAISRDAARRESAKPFWIP